MANIEQRKINYTNDDGVDCETINFVQINDDGTETIRATVDREVQTEDATSTLSDTDIIQAQILLNQQEIKITHQSQDAVLAEILLAQQTI